MLYDMNCEPGHSDVPFTHVSLEQYQPGGERYEKLWASIEQANRFTFGDGGEVNGGEGIGYFLL